MNKKLLAFVIGAVVGLALSFIIYHYWKWLIETLFFVALAGFFGVVFLNNTNWFLSLFNKAKSKVQ